MCKAYLSRHGEVEVGCAAGPRSHGGAGTQNAHNTAAWDGVLVGPHLLSNLLNGAPVVPAQGQPWSGT